MPEVFAPGSGPRPPLVLLVLFAAFVCAMGYLIASSLVPRDVPVFSPSAAAYDAPPASARVDTVTFDARDAERWTWYSISDRRHLVLPDTAGWELAVRRYHLVVPGAAADLGPVELAAVASAPEADFLPPDGRDDAGHPAMRRWYNYGMLTHLLESRRHVYVVPTSDGAHAAIEVLSYYCPGPTPGCLTIRYAHPVGARETASVSRSEAP